MFQKGQKTLQIVTGADRENVTVLAACSASGKVLPPMIVNQGQHAQSTWQPNIDSKHEFYPWQYTNSKGWMTSETFFKWFKKFEEKTRTLNEAGEVEPRLLIYDGPLSYVWFETLKYAQEKKVVLLKLPPHTTELFQPLDVAIFKSLKGIWGSALFQRLKLERTKLSKAEFAELISMKKVWGPHFVRKILKMVLGNVLFFL